MQSLISRWGEIKAQTGLFWALTFIGPKIRPIRKVVLPRRTFIFSIKGKPTTWKFHSAINRFWMWGHLPGVLDCATRLRSQSLSAEVLVFSSSYAPSTIMPGMYCAKTTSAAFPKNNHWIVQMLTQGSSPSRTMDAPRGIDTNCLIFVLKIRPLHDGWACN